GEGGGAPPEGGGRKAAAPVVVESNRLGGGGRREGRVPQAAGEAAGVGTQGLAGDGGAVAAGAGGVSVGPPGRTAPGEQEAAARRQDAPRPLADPDADAPGSAADQGRGGSRAIAALRQGDEELLERSVSLLRVDRHSAGQQRPGTLVRKLSLPRAAGEWSEAAVRRFGRERGGAGGGRPGDAGPSGRRAHATRGVRGGVAAF